MSAQLLFAVLLTPVPVAIEATGMEPQLQAIRSVAAEHGWKVTCQGRAGEEGVVRIAAPAGTDGAEMKGFADELMQFASSTAPVDSELAASPTCNRDAAEMRSSAHSDTLAFGASEDLLSLQEIARACGFKRANVRPWKETDGSVGVKVRPGWQVLAAGEDAVSRYGPVTCFVNMGLSPLHKRK